MRYLLLFFLCYAMPILVIAEGCPPAGTRINLNATVEAHVPNDEVLINFRVEKEGTNTDVIRQYVNQVSAAIQKRLDKESGLKLKTINRQMQPIWQHVANKPRQRTGWRMIQTAQVVSHNLDAIPAWLQAIESEGAHLSSLQFRISSDKAKKVQARLRLQAITLFRNKAAMMAQGLGAKSFKVIHLNSSRQAPRALRYQGEIAMMNKSAALTVPSLVSGEGKMSLTMQGEIETPFIDFPAHNRQ
ncbi:MAG: SIMPL domain-containing protein [Mariprofundus sp.]|nr:SIMPL domain-containing protein [Mariprofundus sp.]